MSLSPTLTINKKVEHYIRINTPKPIVLRFWVERGINVLCCWAHVSLVFVLPRETSSVSEPMLKSAQTSAVELTEPRKFVFYPYVVLYFLIYSQCET